MWRACVLPWGKIVARVNYGEEGGRARRERERESAVPGFIYPQGNCNVPPYTDQSMELLYLSVSPCFSRLFSLRPFVILFLSIFLRSIRDSSSIIRNMIASYASHTRRPLPEIYTVLTLTTPSILPTPPLRMRVPTHRGNLSKLRSSLNRATLILLTSYRGRKRRQYREWR